MKYLEYLILTLINIGITFSICTYFAVEIMLSTIGK